MKLASYIFPSLLAISFGLGNTCSSQHSERVAPGPGDVVYEVTTAEPVFVNRPRYVKAKGVFEASDELIVRADVEGNITKVFVGEGDLVNQGDPLVSFDNEDLTLEIEKKQAELKKAESQLETLTGFSVDSPEGEENERLPSPTERVSVFLDEDLPEKPIEDKENLENEGDEKDEKRVQIIDDSQDPQASAKDLEKQIESLNKEIDQLERQMEKLQIKAKIGGVIQKSSVTEGSRVSENDELLKIVTLNPISMNFSVPEDVSSYVDKLVEVEASPVSAPEIKSKGVVYYISPTVDKDTKRLEVRIRVPNEKGLIKAGLEGQALLTTRKVDRMMVVPQEAVFKEENEYYVYIVSGFKTKKISVDAFEHENNQMIIDGNIRVDDLVIISGLANLQDGSFVAVKKAAQPTARP